MDPWSLTKRCPAFMTQQYQWYFLFVAQLCQWYRWILTHQPFWQFESWQSWRMLRKYFRLWISGSGESTYMMKEKNHRVRKYYETISWGLVCYNSVSFNKQRIIILFLTRLWIPDYHVPWVTCVVEDWSSTTIWPLFSASFTFFDVMGAAASF